MIRDATVRKRVSVPVGERTLVYEEHVGIVGDHVIDRIARRYAIGLRTDTPAGQQTSYTLARSMNRAAT
ncbi:MAG: hypothetical protein ACO32I_01250 [Candidatus Limnocylindrus sp.]